MQVVLFFRKIKFFVIAKQGFGRWVWAVEAISSQALYIDGFAVLAHYAYSWLSKPLLTVI
jgi:hypothetical protein